MQSWIHIDLTLTYQIVNFVFLYESQPYKNQYKKIYIHILNELNIYIENFYLNLKLTQGLRRIASVVSYI
jgi:hypothetical protein